MKIFKYQKCRKGQIYLCIEKLDKYIQKIKTVSYELQSYVFEESAKREISDIYTDQKFQIIVIKKSVEAHNPIMPYLTKTTKTSVSSTSVYSRIFKIQVLEQFWKFHPFEDKIFCKRL